MKLKGLIAVVYDIECMPNLFTVSAKNTESKNKMCYEISERKNDFDKIINLFDRKNVFFVGYNNLHYDDLLINFCLQEKNRLYKTPYFDVCAELKKLSDEIITAQNNGWAALKSLKYANNFNSLDLLAMLFSNKLRVGLKEMEVTMEYNNVREYEHDFNRAIHRNNIDDLITYNFNDVEATEALLYRCEEDIKLRLAVEQEYGISALNKDGVNLGMEILKTKYLELTGLTWNDIKDLRSPCDVIAFKDVIFPFIKFNSSVLKDLLKYLMKTSVSLINKEKFKYNFILGNRQYTFGIGGLHTVNLPEIHIADNQTIIKDIDVASLYPSIIIEHKVYPPHLGEAFLKVYSGIKEERIEAKHAGNKLKDKTLKLSINGLSGNLQSEYSWCYSPLTAFRIRINGQLMLLMLAEALIDIGVEIIQANTDGLFIKYDKNLNKQVDAICRAWEKKTKLILEDDTFEAFYQYAINDYIGVKEGYAATHNPKLIKTKGLFINEVTLGKGMAPMIIPECLIEYFVNGKAVDDTLKNCTDIKKFLTYQKVSKDFSVEYNNQPVTHINRYYMSTNGYRLLKCKDGKKINICADSGVTIVNELDKAPIVKDAHINYGYYKREVYKIIYALEDSLNPTLF